MDSTTMIVLLVLLSILQFAATLPNGPLHLDAFSQSPYELVPLGDATSVEDYNDSGLSLSAMGKTGYGETVELASKSGSRMVVGAPHYSSDGGKLINAGRIYLYDFDETDKSWKLIWFLTGASQNEKLGNRLSLSGDGTRLAVRRHNPNRVVIYDLGQAQNGRVSVLAALGNHDFSTNGDTVTLSPDGGTLAVSDESANGFSGQVTIFRVEAETSWLVWLHTIEGVANSQGRFGWRTSFSNNGELLVVSAPNYDGKKGLVRAYQRQSDRVFYKQVGQDLVGRSPREQFGFALMTSANGTHLISSSPSAGGNGILRGTVTVWRFSSEEDAWVQVGKDVNGPVDRDRLGRSVSISLDGQTVAMTSYLHNSIRGWTKVLNFVPSENIWRVVDIVEGEEYNDKMGYGLFGMSMTEDSCLLAVGSVMAKGYPLGKVQLYQLVDHRSEAPSSGPSIYLEAQDEGHSPRPARRPTHPSVAPTRQRDSAPPSSAPHTDSLFSQGGLGGELVGANGAAKKSSFPVFWVIFSTTIGAICACCCFFCFGARTNNHEERDKGRDDGC